MKTLVCAFLYNRKELLREERGKPMFWDKVAGVYDLFENFYNKKVYRETGIQVAKLININDKVLECACGTGAISIYIAKKAKRLVATDYSVGMLRQARKKLSSFSNVRLAKADITKLKYADNSFDKVVAGNVIHLLPEPKAALQELTRVCKPGGRLIIPTYINDTKSTNKASVRFLEKLGANFKQQFDENTYREFFQKMGYTDVIYHIVEGRMACDIAVIEIPDTK